MVTFPWFLDIRFKVEIIEFFDNPLRPRMRSSPSNGLSSSEPEYAAVYEELRRLAHSQMAKEYAYSTLQGTALVHEAWLRLGAADQPEWQNRRHLFAAASQAMRRILVERARKRKRKKNGGDLRRVPEESIDSLRPRYRVENSILEISDALERFETIDPQKAELVRLRYFFGLSFEESAETMGVSLSTVKRWWAYARSWLHREIESG